MQNPKDMNRRWEEGSVIKKECTEKAWISRDGVRKAKTQCKFKFRTMERAFSGTFKIQGRLLNEGNKMLTDSKGKGRAT